MRHKLLRNTALGILMLSLGVGLTSAHGPTWTMPYNGSTSSSTGAFTVSNSNGYVAYFAATNPSRVDPTLHAAQMGTGQAVYGVSQRGDGIYGHTSSSSLASSGVVGVGISGIGVTGRSTSNTGVYGTTTTGDAVHGSSTNGTGVVGMINGACCYGVIGMGPFVGVLGLSNDGNGIYGHSLNRFGVNGSSRSGIAVYGESPNGIGVYALSTDNIGVYGASSNSNGVHGFSSGGYAGHFNGNVNVVGTLSKGAGGFKIDHPLDPANKYLSHAFVESPDMKTMYDGTVILDAKGGATVELPAWFEALNRDVRYQLTAIGAPAANLHIAEEVANNRFAIAGGTSGLKVAWQVIGIRHDAYANAHRIPVEEDKLAAERGKYLHPKEHGQAEAMGIHYADIQRMQQSQAEMRQRQAEIQQRQAEMQQQEAEMQQRQAEMQQQEAEMQERFQERLKEILQQQGRDVPQ
jgi:hypothetical protein